MWGLDGAHERDAAREAAAICLDLPAVAALVLRVEPVRFLMKTFVECAGARSCFVERTAEQWARHDTSQRAAFSNK